MFLILIIDALSPNCKKNEESLPEGTFCGDASHPGKGIDKDYNGWQVWALVLLNIPFWVCVLWSCERCGQVLSFEYCIAACMQRCKGRKDIPRKMAAVLHQPAPMLRAPDLALA